ncbi:WD40 repeat-like protein [Pluteus cervinus]|uniref:WD40 repeat-like protein n=1 Tax=Pluteus cervinus TaxID=181527 RepID=A0ACD3B0T6_9AGAR|nr:WD40 repeat-like protein [Pluteus cervinus]
MGIGLAGLDVGVITSVGSITTTTPTLVVPPTPPPPTHSSTSETRAHPPSLLSCSPNNVLLFTRGNRVHYKNITSNEEVGQLCKLQESHGDVQIICCGGSDQPDVVALGTSTGLIQIWDLKAKKKTSSWSTKGVSSMRWNGATLTVGGLKGTIRHYDTRISPTVKMKEQSRKVTRHQARITSLDWNVEGTLLASGDESGIVYCWDSRQKVPLDVGEFVQRRKKMQHEGCVRALAWCPWQPKLLASGDDRGVVRLWNVNANNAHSNAAIPGKLELGASVTGIHFSPHCKEFLTTHGSFPILPTSPRTTHYSHNHNHNHTLSGMLTPTTSTSSSSQQSQSQSTTLVWPQTPTRNCIQVHSYPSLRHVTTLSVSDKPIEGGVMNPLGTKMVVAVPGDGKLHLCDVWQKRKEVKRQPSFLSSSTIR